MLNWQQLPPVVSALAALERLQAEREFSAGQDGEPAEFKSAEFQLGVAGTGRLIFADVRWQPPAQSLRADYLQAHIPGAIFVDLETQLSDPEYPGGVSAGGRHPFPDEDTFAQTLSELGINFEDTVLSYGGADPMGAARFTLMLRLSGVNAALIDGGLPAFEEVAAAAGIELEAGENVLESSYFEFQPFVNLVSIDQVAHAMQSSGAILLDARAPERFRGEVEPIDARPGRIPGAKNLPYQSLLDSAGKFLPPGQIQEMLEAVGVSKTRITFNYCGSGVSAAVNMLAMELAGFEQANLFPGSYSQWSADPAREVELG